MLAQYVIRGRVNRGLGKFVHVQQALSSATRHATNRNLKTENRLMKSENRKENSENRKLKKNCAAQLHEIGHSSHRGNGQSRACCREVKFSKTLAWVIFWCLFMCRINIYLS